MTQNRKKKRGIFSIYNIIIDISKKNKYIYKFVNMKVHVESENDILTTGNNVLNGGKRCRRPNCRSTARIGEYCEVHALQKHEAMVSNPDLYAYLNDSTLRSRFQSWFIKKSDTVNVNRMLLWYAIDNFKSCSSPELRKSRSRKIYKKYLSTNSNLRVRVHTRVEDLCQSSFSKFDFIPSEILYQVQGAIFLSLERIFLNSYITSSEFISFAEMQKKKLISQKQEDEGKNNINNKAQWGLPGDFFRNKTFTLYNRQKRKSRVENYRNNLLSNERMDLKSDTDQILYTNNTSSSIMEKSLDFKLAYDTTRNLKNEILNTNNGKKTRTKISLIPRSAKGNDTGLLITPRSSRLEEMDEASAALIVASFGGNVARRTTK